MIHLLKLTENYLRKSLQKNCSFKKITVEKICKDPNKRNARTRKLKKQKPPPFFTIMKNPK